MAAWLANVWGQTWPNLLANVLWIPVVGVHHLAMKRHIGRLHAQHGQHVQALLDRTEKP
ncbi:hypothetical protein [Streptomyces mirabilis]|uniref:hypothetical protein n=1 Tax=Streptomyces mirabilis TaxID=68239 RepID=UPI0036D8A337